MDNLASLPYFNKFDVFAKRSNSYDSGGDDEESNATLEIGSILSSCRSDSPISAEVILREQQELLDGLNRAAERLVLEKGNNDNDNHDHEEDEKTPADDNDNDDDEEDKTLSFTQRIVEERKRRLNLDAGRSRQKILEECYWELYRQTWGFTVPPPPIVGWEQRREERGYKSRSFMKNQR